MKLKVEKTCEGAKLPTRAHETDAGYDFYTPGRAIVLPHSRALLRTGVKIAVPDGMAMILKEKSGITLQHGLQLGAGVVDCAYRGEVKVLYYNPTDTLVEFAAGDKIVQGLLVNVNALEVEEAILDSTERNEGGFGSTGVQ